MTYQIMDYLKLSVISLAFFSTVALAQQHVLSHADLPWQPTHVETFNNLNRSLIGSLKKNGFDGDGNFAVLDARGIIKSFKNVIDFGTFNSTGGFFIISDDHGEAIVSSYDQNLTKISSRSFSSNLVKWSIVSVSKDGTELVFSSPSPDMSSRKSLTKYSGHNFSHATNYAFSEAPLYQAISFGDNLLAINVDRNLVAFEGENIAWTYEPNPYISVNSLSASQDKQYLIVKSDVGDVAIIGHSGKEIFRVKNKGGSAVTVKDNVAVITNNGVTKKYSLETGREIEAIKR
ncbi:hypothetical protein [Pseudidiomarina sp.]|uniref:hypothetical protein n=1 Tax=Pseudidiomarina sp. TaxID=2081707 RepID=UPI003A96C61C